MNTNRIPGPLGRVAQRRGIAKLPAPKIAGKPERVMQDFAEPLFPIQLPLLVAPRRNTNAPTDDGEVNLYIFQDLGSGDLGGKKIKDYLDSTDKVSADMDWTRRAIFINGMGNKGKDNKASSCILSLMQLCPVISVYNRKSDLAGDLSQCLRDQLKFQASAINPNFLFELLATNKKAKTDRERILLMKNALLKGMLGNKATAALFEILADGDGKNKDIPIYAHSQGNLILSNALQAVKIVLGANAIKGRKVYSYGSPSNTWPSEIVHYDHAFTFDIVSLINLNYGFSTSKVGMPDNTANPFTHGFLWYLQEDAAFIINRHRFGPSLFTLNMNEKGLAKELVSFGVNENRLIRVFRRLKEKHSSDADDVAAEYTDLMRKGKHDEKLKAMKKLTAELIHCMDGGWTGTDELAHVSYLKSL